MLKMVLLQKLLEVAFWRLQIPFVKAVQKLRLQHVCRGVPVCHLQPTFLTYLQTGWPAPCQLLLRSKSMFSVLTYPTTRLDCWPLWVQKQSSLSAGPCRSLLEWSSNQFI